MKNRINIPVLNTYYLAGANFKLRSAFILKLLITMVIMIAYTNSKAQSFELITTTTGTDTLWYNTKGYLVTINNPNNMWALDSVQSSPNFGSFDSTFLEKNTGFYFIKSSDTNNATVYENLGKLLKDTLGSAMDVYTFFGSETGNHFILTNHLVIGLIDKNDFSLVQSHATTYGYQIIDYIDKDSLMVLIEFSQNGSKNAMQLANELYGLNDFRYVEPNFVFNNTLTNDPQFNKQWALNNTGSNYPCSTATLDPDAHIQLENIWSSYGLSCASLKIAILDNSVQPDHFDLWNPTNTYGYNALSEDLFFVNNNGVFYGNGFKYDKKHYYFDDARPEPIWHFCPAKYRPSHGTAVAGISSALENNYMIVGVSPGSIAIGVKTFDRTNFHYSSSLTVLHAFYKAVDEVDADIINCSFSIFFPGYNFPSKQGDQDPYDSYIMTDGIDYAIQKGRGGKGAIIVASTGNHGYNTVGFPASHPNTIAVTGSNSCDERKTATDCSDEAWGASYGAETDIAAPCVGIYTTDLKDNYNGSGYADNEYYYCLDPQSRSEVFPNSSGFTYFSGTSASAPMVSGAVSLMLNANRFLTHEQIREALLSNADKVGGYSYTTTTGYDHGTWHEEMGYGRLNTYNAVYAAASTHAKFFDSYNNPYQADQVYYILGSSTFLRFNIDNKAMSNSIKWYRNGLLYEENWIPELMITVPGKYTAVYENDCGNGNTIKFETIEFVMPCGSALFTTYGGGGSGPYIFGPGGPPTNLSNTDFYFDDDIIIQPAAVLNIANCKIMMKAGTRIIVEQGGLLNIAADSDLFGCDNCNPIVNIGDLPANPYDPICKMWEGILVNDPSQGPGAVAEIYMHQVRISDAVSAVYLTAAVDVDIFEVDFANNYNHMLFKDATVHAAYKVERCNFNYLTPHFHTWSTTPPGHTDYWNNSFTERYMFYVENTNNRLDILKNNFNDKSEPKINDLTALHIDNLSNLYLFDNDFEVQSVYDVRVHNSSDPLISENRFVSGIMFPFSLDYTSGLEIKDCNDVVITENSFRYYKYALEVYSETTTGIIDINTNRIELNYVGVICATHENPKEVCTSCSSSNNYTTVQQVQLTCNAYIANTYGILGIGDVIDQGDPNATPFPLHTGSYHGNNVSDLFWVETNQFSPHSEYIYDISLGTIVNLSPFSFVELDGVAYDVSEPSMIVENPSASGPTCNTLPPQMLDPVTVTEITKAEQTLKLYPNPANTQINVELTGASDNEKIIEIFNMNGQKILSQKTHNSIENLNIGHLKEGVYFIRLISDNQVFNSKFIKISN